MKYRKPLTIILLVVAVVVLPGIALAQAPPTTPVYKLVTTITLPGGLAGFDISWVDPGSQLFYLADRTRTKGTGQPSRQSDRANLFVNRCGGWRLR